MARTRSSNVITVDFRAGGAVKRGTKSVSPPAVSEARLTTTVEPSATAQGNPWVRLIGKYKDDPSWKNFDDFLKRSRSLASSLFDESLAEAKQAIRVYLIDTNTMRHAVYEPDKYPLVVENLPTYGHLVWISVVTAQELIEWRYNPLLISASQQPPYVLRVYNQFFEILKDVCRLSIMPFDEKALKNFSGMPGSVGVQDRRIAATALANDFIMVSHDTDFSTIKKRKPQLKLVDWVTTPPA